MNLGRACSFQIGLGGIITDSVKKDSAAQLHPAGDEVESQAFRGPGDHADSGGPTSRFLEKSQNGKIQVLHAVPRPAFKNDSVSRSTEEPFIDGVLFCSFSFRKSGGFRCDGS